MLSMHLLASLRLHGALPSYLYSPLHLHVVVLTLPLPYIITMKQHAWIGTYHNPCVHCIKQFLTSAGTPCFKCVV